MREQAEALVDRAFAAAGEVDAALRRLRPRLPRGRGRHHRLAPEGPAAPADLRLRARPGRRAQGLGPLDRGPAPARRARPGEQAPSAAAQALRRPCDGGRLHDRAESTSTSSAAPCRRSRAKGSTPRTLERSASPATGRSPPSDFDAGDRAPARGPGLGRGVRGADLLRCGRGRLAAPGRREAPEARGARSAASSATRSGSAGSSRSASGCAWPTASASTATTASSGCR